MDNNSRLKKATGMGVISLYLYCHDKSNDMYGVYVSLSPPIQFCPLPNQNFEKMPKILQILRNPGSRIRVGFSRFSWGSNHFINEIPCHIKQYNMDNQAQHSEVLKIIMFCQNSRLKIKHPRAWNMSGYWHISEKKYGISVNLTFDDLW